MSGVGQIDLSTVIRQRDGLQAHDVDETLVLTDEKSACCYGLDFIARRIWQLVKRPKSVAALCAMLADEYHIDQESCERDILGFLGELRREGLIEMAAAAETDEEGGEGASLR